MANIYSRTNRIMNSMQIIFFHLKKNYFGALSNDIEFDMALKRAKAFFKLDDNETALLTYIFIDYFDFNERPVNIGLMANDAGANPLRFLEFRDAFTSLEEKGYITADTVDDPLSKSKYFRVTEGVVNAVVNDNPQLLEKELRVRDNALTYPDEIEEKTVFYMDAIKADVQQVSEYLEEDKLEKIRQRLEEKSMSKGICIMLHGASGTGKTETVYQLAKKTGRAIYHIDIGSTISCWHGGTERNLSILFEKYRRLCRQMQVRGEKIPILLFNEADALFGRRLERPSQGSEIDENHIQSVLLDYLEKQEGIVIVTTNLSNNFDDAFERRFLFKIEFEKPDLQVKMKIWKDKVSWLNKASVQQLASNYSLSGAEIDNVVRKATMNEVLTGKKSSVKDLEYYCQKEKLHNSSNMKIGFGN